MAERSLFDIERLTAFRRKVHSHPELAYQEVETSKLIIEYLKSLGVEDSQIRRMAKTGIVVDLKGKGPENGKPYMIALRADMDCLPIKENNDLEYKSDRDDRAHMCGHDGHCAWLLGAASKILEKIDLIPSNKTVRLLFQPAEEDVGGAVPMIQEGCLEGVNEVYGAHNAPVAKTGACLIKDGPVLSQLTDISVTVKGKGGHGSMPQLANDPLPAAVEIYMKHQEIMKGYEELTKKRMMVSTLPFFRCGDAPNVIHDTAEIKGTLRAFDEKVTFDFKSKFQKACEEVCAKHGVKLSITLETSYPAVINSPEETKMVTKLAKEVYGEQCVGDWGLPGPGSEDFSYYTRYLPGVFFFPTSGKQHQDNPFIHESTYDFDDEAIEKCSELFYKIIAHQFGVKEPVAQESMAQESMVQEPVKQQEARSRRFSSTDVSDMGRNSDDGDIEALIETI